MEIKISIYKVNTIKKLFRRPIYVFEIPFVYSNETPVNDIIFNTYINESDRDRLKYSCVSNVRMYVKQNEYENFIKAITSYYKFIREKYPRYIKEILRKVSYVSNWVNAEKYDDIIIWLDGVNWSDIQFTPSTLFNVKLTYIYSVM